jgi:hypothetical protein
VVPCRHVWLYVQVVLHQLTRHVSTFARKTAHEDQEQTIQNKSTKFCCAALAT